MALGPRHLEQAQRALREGGSARFVGRARIVLPSRDGEARLRFALEDGLRTAEFGDCGRLIVIRALRLGRLALHASGADIARAIEAAWREAAPQALHFSDPRAPHAVAVFFRSAHEARCEWLRRAAHGEPLDAWFWTRALPQIRSTDTLAAAVGAAFVSVLETAAGELGRLLAAWPQHAVQRLATLLAPDDARVIEAVAAALPALAETAPAALGTLLRAWPSSAVQRLTSRAPMSAAAREVLSVHEPAHEPLASGAGGSAGESAPQPDAAPVASAAQRRGRHELRRASRHAALAAAPMPSADSAQGNATEPTFAPVRDTVPPPGAVERPVSERRIEGIEPRDLRHGQVAAMPRRSDAEQGRGHPAPAARASAVAGDATAMQYPLAPAGISLPTPAPCTQAPWRSSAAAGASQRAMDIALPLTAPAQDGAAAGAGRVPAMPWPWLEGGATTKFGGFLILLNALSLLRFDPWLRRQAPIAQECFAAALLGTIADRLGMPQDDPQRELFWLAGDDAAALAEQRMTWEGFAWPRWLAAPLPARAGSCAAAVRIWRLAARRALRAHARIGIADAARRSAGIWITPTHVDVVMALDDVDLRLRAAGLDADPGWVPWFGRIVGFHFLAGSKERSRA